MRKLLTTTAIAITLATTAVAGPGGQPIGPNGANNLRNNDPAFNRVELHTFGSIRDRMGLLAAWNWSYDVFGRVPTQGQLRSAGVIDHNRTYYNSDGGVNWTAMGQGNDCPC